MTEENREENDLIELIDEDGQSVSFDHLATLDYEGETYLILADPDQEASDDDLEIIVMQVSQDEDGNDLYSAPDEETADAVFAYFLKMCDETEADDEGEA